MTTVAAFHAMHCLKEELRHMRYNTDDDTKYHLRPIRNKELDLADCGNKLSFTKTIMHTLQSFSSTVQGFEWTQTKILGRSAPAKDMNELEKQIRALISRYQLRKLTKGLSQGSNLHGDHALF